MVGPCKDETLYSPNMLRLIGREPLPVNEADLRTIHVHRMSGPIITVRYHKEDTIRQLCEMIRQQLPEFSQPSYHYYRWNAKHVKLVKEEGEFYSAPFLLHRLVSHYVEDGDTIYMLYDVGTRSVPTRG